MQQRVLIIDEGTYRADSMAIGLRDAGYEVSVVQKCSVVELKDYIAKLRPDVVMYEDGNLIAAENLG